ncbi:MAG: helix-turn-helix transcriptional regulator [Flavobacteriales bacterium]|nr:helix-turn-helix transcriptional regulator [Flavobacteriales bacterium]
MDQTTIGRYERGQTDPPISVVLHICKLCGACISQFEGCDLPPLPGTKHRNKKDG